MGSFIENNLGRDERIEYQAEISAWSVIPYVLVGLLTFWIIVGFFAWGAAISRFFATELAVTNKKVISKTGLISRDTIEILHSKVEGVRVQQGLFGRLMNYGDVIITGTGISHTPIRGIKDPVAFRNAFLEINEKAKP